MCPRLKIVDLEGCDNITSKAVRALSSLKQLTEVAFDFDDLNDDEGLDEIGNSRFLKTLNLSHGTITDTTLLCCTKHCPDLAQLSLKSSSVTDTGVIAVAQAF